MFRGEIPVTRPPQSCPTRRAKVVPQCTKDGDQVGERTLCIGNGNNDRLMLAAAALAIAVVQAEGAAQSALAALHIVRASVRDALDLLVHPKRIVATLRVPSEPSGSAGEAVVSTCREADTIAFYLGGRRWNDALENWRPIGRAAPATLHLPVMDLTTYGLKAIMRHALERPLPRRVRLRIPGT